MHKLPRTMQTLAKRSSTLRTLLTEGAGEYKLFKAAERVRDARIKVLQATIGAMPSVLLTPPQRRRIAKLDREIEKLRAAMPIDIVAEFRLARPANSRDD